MTEVSSRPLVLPAPSDLPGSDAGRTAVRRFRPEIQGLRALAVALVVVYHVWFNRVSGGVDVFFVLTGFLLTGQMLRAAERGQIPLRTFFGRLLTRLLPAALTVLVVTAVAGMLVLPESRWNQTVREIAASALYLQNWQLAADAVDYAAKNSGASVVQHFWSLSIQGQVYLVLPFLVALVALIARQAGGRIAGYLGVTLLGVFVASLTYSISLTASDQPLAYFHSLTRIWEFALGGLLALVVDAVVLSRLSRVLLGWLGVVGLVSCGIVLQVSTVFPGWAALWPTVSAVLIVVAGASGSRLGADRWLSARPVRYLGDLSYSLYLWHWPVLLYYFVLRDREAVGFVGGAGVIALSLVLAALTYHLVEEPVRKSRLRLRNQYWLGALATAVLLLVVAGWHLASLQRSNVDATAGSPTNPGAQARVAPSTYEVDFDAPLVPAMVDVGEDWARVEYWDCEPMERFPEMDACTQPVEGTPERRIVLTGDSHAQQYAAALAPIAERRGWQIITMLRGACPFSTASESVPGEQGCIDWNAAVVDEAVDRGADAVFALASREVRVGLTEETPPGFVEQWWKMHERGIPVIAARDNPRFPYRPAECLADRGRGAAAACGKPRGALYRDPAPFLLVEDVPPNVTFLDHSDYICEDDVCPAEIGGVIVYMDDNHLTASFASTLAPILEQELDAALGW
jgi:peptidoglycan/LPS O-acetylase OafA/YrhL